MPAREMGNRKRGEWRERGENSAEVVEVVGMQ